MAETFVKEITPRNQDYSQWYVDVITKSDLVDYAPVKGMMVIKPYGYALWERIQAGLDRRFKATGHQNAYFPLLIPESFMQREAEHVEGFAPELAWVTHGGGETLQERLAIRPTSEAIIGPMYAKWVQSYRDLPVLINQWCSVVRWEKATRPFLRTTEFLWQEGHTVHATAEEAHQETMRMLNIYRDFLENEMALPVIVGEKSASEKFAGAERTYSCEALMGDNRALQVATSHYFGEQFARAFEIRFLDKDGQLHYGNTTSWGSSTRMIGAIVMVHGDDRGLVMPPKLAPTQVVMVPIAPVKDRESVLTRVRQVRDSLSSTVRVHLDDREEYTAGWKFNDWEMRGVPLRLELGPRDLKANQVVLVRRDTGERVTAPLENLVETVTGLLGEIQDNLLRSARERQSKNSAVVESMDELRERMSSSRGLLMAGWCGSEACERSVKEETGATIRNLPLEQQPVDRCIVCGQAARHLAVFARAY